MRCGHFAHTARPYCLVKPLPSSHTLYTAPGLFPHSAATFPQTAGSPPHLDVEAPRNPRPCPAYGAEVTGPDGSPFQVANSPSSLGIPHQITYAPSNSRLLAQPAVRA